MSALNYRSMKRRVTAWAEDDGRPFRDERDDALGTLAVFSKREAVDRGSPERFWEAYVTCLAGRGYSVEGAR